jgi:serine/threonine protein phosphatase PrpC
MGSPTASMTTAIAAALGAAQPSADVAQKLLQCALDAGGRDNITVIVATFRL